MIPDGIASFKNDGASMGERHSRGEKRNRRNHRCGELHYPPKPEILLHLFVSSVTVHFCTEQNDCTALIPQDQAIFDDRSYGVFPRGRSYCLSIALPPYH